MIYVTKRQMKEALKRKRKRERYIDPAEQKYVQDYDKKLKNKKVILVQKQVAICENCGTLLFSPNYSHKDFLCDNCLEKLKGDKMPIKSGKQTDEPTKQAPKGNMVGRISSKAEDGEYVNTANIWDNPDKKVRSVSINVALVEELIRNNPAKNKEWCNIGLLWLNK